MRGLLVGTRSKSSRFQRLTLRSRLLRQAPSRSQSLPTPVLQRSSAKGTLASRAVLTERVSDEAVQLQFERCQVTSRGVWITTGLPG